MNMLNIPLDLGIKVNLTGIRSAGVSFGMILLINRNASIIQVTAPLFPPHTVEAGVSEHFADYC